MIGLLKKDFFLSKKLFYIYCGLTLLIVALSYTIRFAFDYGNLAKYDDSTNVCDFIFTILPTLIFGVSSLLFTINPILEDKDSGFINYAISSPVSRKEIVFIKLIESFLLCFINGIALILLACIYGSIFGFSDVISGIYMIIFLTFITLIINLTAIPLAFRCKTQNLVLGFLLLIYGAPTMATLIISTNVVPKKFEEFLMTAIPKYTKFCQNYLDFFLLAIIAISILVSYVVYLISRKIIERRLAV